MSVARAKTVRRQKFSIPHLSPSASLVACSIGLFTLGASVDLAHAESNHVEQRGLGAITVTTGTQNGDPFVSGRPTKALFAGPTVVTSGFSGSRSQAPSARQSSARDARFINPNGATVSLTAIDNLGTGFNGLEIKRRPYDRLLAKDTGQVFGLAIDDANKPNLYLTATSAYGLPVVGRDRNGDGLPDKLYAGRTGARFMHGLFGPNRDNGPGSVWKVDGRTGQVSLFASLTLDGVPNSGPGLGNIAFDAQSNQLFVSDLDTGVIFRLDVDGHVLETFDHGTTARGLAGLHSIAFDPSNRLDITNPSFDVEDPDSWHFAAEKRRVWGLAAHKGRLYYSVADGPEIWSVGIQANDGAFLFDARKEFSLPDSYPSFEISDITFGPDGSMVLAQRGERLGSYDFTRITKARRAETIRVLKNRDGSWRSDPEPYAIGFANQMRNGTGGVAMGPAYAFDGRLDSLSCKGVLWATGEQLRNRPQLANRLSQGGALNVDGAQAQPFGVSRAENSPPWFSYFLDFDGAYPDRKMNGQMGDVEVFGCPGIGNEAPEVVEYEPEPPVEQPKADLKIKKTTVGDCLVNRQRRSYSCDFKLTITNRGEGVFDGPVVLTDQFERPAPLDAYIRRGKGWTCSKPRDGSFSCLKDRLVLKPGKSISVTTRMLLPGQVRKARYYNCAMLGVGSSYRQQVTVAQLSMKPRGIASGGVDGRMGPNTRRGLKKLQDQLGLDMTGDVGPALFDALGVPMGAKSGLSCAPALLKGIPLPPVYEEPPIVVEPPVYEEPPIIILPPEQTRPFCDRATTVQRGNSCACRYGRMRKVSQSQCTCRRGTRLVRGRGCVRVQQPLACDPSTSVQNGNACQCLYPNMRRDTALSCACRPGTKLVAGRGCVVLRQPPVVRCDRRTTVAMNGRCECRFQFMHKTSPTSCSCNPGSKFVRNQGCVPVGAPPIKPALICDPLTTRSRGNSCACLYRGMQKTSKTSCSCRRGTVFQPGKGCKVPVVKPPVIKPPVIHQEPRQLIGS